MSCKARKFSNFKYSKNEKKVKRELLTADGRGGMDICWSRNKSKVSYTLYLMKSIKNELFIK